MSCISNDNRRRVVNRKRGVRIEHDIPSQEDYHLIAASAKSDRNPVPDAVGLPDAPQVFASASGGFGMSFFELDCFWPNLGLTKAIHEDAIVIGLQLRACQDFDVYLDGRMIRPGQSFLKAFWVILRHSCIKST